MHYINKVLKTAINTLSKAGVQSPAFDSRELLLFSLGLTRREELLRLSSMDDVQYERFIKLIQRRADRYPLQYILGFWEFYGRRFYVGEGALIPRPDTEVLVSTAIEAAGGARKPRVLDLCSGTGVVAITLSLELAGAQVNALELYPEALDILNRNVRLHGAPVTVLPYDLLCYEPEPAERYDFIVSNPPYIDFDSYEALSKEVHFEPKTALIAPDDGLFFYSKIIERYTPFLSPIGAMLFECGYSQAGAVEELLKAAGYGATKIIKDFSGIDRVVCGFIASPALKLNADL